MHQCAIIGNQEKNCEILKAALKTSHIFQPEMAFWPEVAFWPEMAFRPEMAVGSEMAV